MNQKVVTLLLFVGFSIFVIIWFVKKEKEEDVVIRFVTGKELMTLDLIGRQIIHQSWKTHVIPRGLFLDNFIKWSEFHPKALHVLWSDQENEMLVKKVYPEFYFTFMSKMLSPVQRSDIARLLYLHCFGGLYADLDYEPFTNIFDTLDDKKEMYVVQSPVLLNEVMQNSLMISKQPGQPFWYNALKTIVKIVSYLENLDGCQFGCGDLALFHNVFTQQLATMVKTTSITGPSVLDKTFVLYHSHQQIGLLPVEKYFAGTFAKHHHSSVWVNIPWAMKEIIVGLIACICMWNLFLYWYFKKKK